MTRRIVTRREHEQEREMQRGMAFECKALSDRIAEGEVVTVEMNGHQFWILGARPYGDGFHPAVVIQKVSDAGISLQEATVVKGKNDELWANILTKAGVPRAPIFVGGGNGGSRIILPGR